MSETMQDEHMAAVFFVTVSTRRCGVPFSRCCENQLTARSLSVPAPLPVKKHCTWFCRIQSVGSVELCSSWNDHQRSINMVS